MQRSLHLSQSEHASASARPPVSPPAEAPAGLQVLVPTKELAGKHYAEHEGEIATALLKCWLWKGCAAQRVL